MKQLLIVALGLLFSLPIHSQNPDSFTSKKNEINIGFFNAFELNNYSDLGIAYKRMTNNGAYRIGTGLFFETADYTENEGHQTSTSFDISPRVGYEFHQYFNRVQLQYGSDLVFSYDKSYLEDINDPIDYYRSEERIRKKIILRPFLGIKVFLTQSISISTETYLNIGYGTETFERVQTGGDAYRTSKGAFVNLGPLGVFSINLHF